MKTSEILIKARDLIADPARWTQGTSARDELGNAVKSMDPRAVCWCSDGALVRASELPHGYEGFARAHRVLVGTAKKMGSRDHINLNETHTHAEVMAMFATAIATAQARGD